MSEIVERVARAICLSEGTDPNSLLLRNPPLPTWSRYVGAARAAITAMREPTEAMMVAGQKQQYCGERGWYEEIPEEACINSWHGMIDAALKDDV